MTTDRRQFNLGLAASVSCFPSLAQAAPCAKTHVLFVCPMGSVKSAIAREELRRAVKARGLPVEVQSRGLTPTNDISPALAAHLRDEGINPLADPLRRFTRADPAKADITIAFDEAGKAAGLEHARVWNSPSWNDDYAHAKAVMDQRIAKLTDELAQRPCIKP
jgi:protein-tyrosine-phosphatase